MQKRPRLSALPVRNQTKTFLNPEWRSKALNFNVLCHPEYILSKAKSLKSIKKEAQVSKLPPSELNQSDVSSIKQM
jgi:hypothetical protein